MNLQNIILINDAAYITGGAGKVVISSARQLARLGFHVILFTAIGPIDETLVKDGIEVICLQQYDILTDPNRFRAICQGIWNRKAQKEFRKLLSKYNFQNTIVHYHAWTKSLSPSIFQITSSMKYPIVVTLHDFFTCCPNGGLYNYQKEQICKLKPLSLSCLMCNCDVRNYLQKIWRCIRQTIQNKELRNHQKIAFIAISSLCKKVNEPYLQQFHPQWYHLNNPIELNEQSMVDITKNDAYLFIGRLSAEKGAELFCRAITDLGLKGFVLGEGYQREYLQSKFPNITFTGWVEGSEKEKYIRQSKALVMTSKWYETFGLVVAEMKSYGIPCIVPDRCAAAEQIENGRTGYIFKTGNLDSLKEAILKYEHSNKSNMQEHILKDFNPNKYSLETHCKKLIEVYSDFMFAKS